MHPTALPQSFSARTRLHGWRLFGLLAALVLLATAVTLALQPHGVEGLRSAIRVTARLSFVLFLASFLASSLNTLLPGPNSRALLRERRFLGLGFAFSHLVHGVLIISYAQLFPETFWAGRSVTANLPGSLGYLCILLLTLTSFPAAIKWLGARTWKALHSSGSWVIVGVFCLSFFKRVPLGWGYALAFAVVVSAIVLKLVAKLAQRQRRLAARHA
ncbi:MAG: hypothetical protein GAK45_02122 [Pseudomonas citronellolis]|nr:MAG: hypothetical protein GAK45_02122 [Pseudomonas citronellolis]